MSLLANFVIILFIKTGERVLDVTTLTVAGVFAGMDPTVNTVPLPEIHLDIEGVLGSRFRRAERWSKTQGRMIPNERMWSCTFEHDLRRVMSNWNQLLEEAGEDGRVTTILPEWLGTNIHFGVDLPDLSLMPVGTRLCFRRGPVLVVELENKPCMNAANFLATKQLGPTIPPEGFVKAALHLRGLVGSVKEGGEIRVGDYCEVTRPN